MVALGAVVGGIQGLATAYLLMCDAAVMVLWSRVSVSTVAILATPRPSPLTWISAKTSHKAQISNVINSQSANFVHLLNNINQ